MKYLDEFRDPQLARSLMRRIRDQASRRWVLMDVCGGQTHGLVRYGIEQALADTVELIHGPGCPVCVTPIETIDFAVELSMQPHTVVASFGDMIRVPGSNLSLMDARSRGGQVKVVYTPIDAVKFARQNPDLEVVFLSVGFETTAPATALAVLQACELELTNFSVICAHVRVLPAMESIARSPDVRVHGFLAAGHVCSVTGFDGYESFVDEHRIPVVVTGFEPVDLLKGILKCVERLERDEPQVANHYRRIVTRDGNQSAMQLIRRVYEVTDCQWRGFGEISASGYRLQNQYAKFDAGHRFPGARPTNRQDANECRGADVMSGKLKPKECPAFGVRCTPELPLGAPMVSSEGACAAYYRFDPVMISQEAKR